MRAAVLFMVAWLASRAEIIDRIAVTVGNGVITESEILREIRLTAFLNGQALDFSPASKRKTAERLVEQRLIGAEINANRYPAPTAAATQEMLKQIQDRFPNPSAFQEELLRVGVTEDELRAHLGRQLTTLSFLDSRFRAGIQLNEEDIQKYFNERLAPELKKAKPGGQFSLHDYHSQALEGLMSERMDKASDAWLKEARDRTRIEFRTGAFAPEPKQKASK